MKLTKEDVLKLARLSRLKLTDQEVDSYITELSSILEYVQQLDSVDVSGLEPTYQVTGLTSNDQNATREDELVPQTSQEQLFKNLPQSEAGQIKVKRMIK